MFEVLNYEQDLLDKGWKPRIEKEGVLKGSLNLLLWISPEGKNYPAWEAIYRARG